MKDVCLDFYSVLEMEKKALNKIEELIYLIETSSIEDFDRYTLEYLNRKSDKKSAIQELDKAIGLLQNQVLCFSLYLKQNHLLNASTNSNIEYYTKHEIAIKFRVSIRTVTNWILEGLETEELGGIKRISSLALERFKNTAKGKKFKWRGQLQCR